MPKRLPRVPWLRIITRKAVHSEEVSQASIRGRMIHTEVRESSILNRPARRACSFNRSWSRSAWTQRPIQVRKPTASAMPQEVLTLLRMIQVSTLHATSETNHRIQIFMRIPNPTRLWMHRKMLRKDPIFTIFWANKAAMSIHTFKPRIGLSPLAPSLKPEASTTS